MRNKLLVTTFVATTMTAVSVGAREHRVNQIPHGDRFGCTSCHRSAAGGGDFTPFGSDSIGALVGSDLLQEADVDWSLLAGRDSDRDGFTNGEELNDPNGLWRIGDPDPVGGVVYHPGDASSHPLATCGDGRVTPPEQCDGTNFGSQTCIGLGLDDGVLHCNTDCTFDTTGCGGEDPAPPDPTPEPPEPTTEDDDSACNVVAAPRAGGGGAGWVALLLALAGWRQRSRPCGVPS